MTVDYGYRPPAPASALQRLPTHSRSAGRAASPSSQRQARPKSHGGAARRVDPGAHRRQPTAKRIRLGVAEQLVARCRVEQLGLALGDEEREQLWLELGLGLGVGLGLGFGFGLVLR